MVSLLLQQLYREILTVADENGGALKDRVMFYMDEFGTLPPINSVEMMYSASRSRSKEIIEDKILEMFPFVKPVAENHTKKTVKGSRKLSQKEFANAKNHSQTQTQIQAQEPIHKLRID